MGFVQFAIKTHFLFLKIPEHVFNPDKAFFEIARTLKQGGSHIFTVPIINKFNETEKWAKNDKKKRMVGNIGNSACIRDYGYWL